LTRAEFNLYMLELFYCVAKRARIGGWGMRMLVNRSELLVIRAHPHGSGLVDCAQVLR